MYTAYVLNDFCGMMKSDCPTLEYAQKFCQSLALFTDELVWEQTEKGNYWASDGDVTDFCIEKNDEGE